MEYIIGFIVGAPLAWLGRGYRMLRRAKKEGRQFDLIESIRTVFSGGRA